MDYRIYAERSRFWVREFLVDLLGCLIPGLIFTFLAVIIVVWPSVRLYRNMVYDSWPPSVQPREQAAGKGPAAEEVRKGPWAAFEGEMLILLVAFSYAIGFVFFRRPDPAGHAQRLDAQEGTDPGKGPRRLLSP